MFAHIEGTIAEKTPDALVIDAQGVGYLIHCSTQTLSQAPAIGTRMKCYTVLSVREDAMDLFGFVSREERTMFEKLRGVTGIGSRSALNILSAMSVRDLTIALITNDLTTLTRAPGIGKKTAQRLVLELRDRVDQGEVNASSGATLPAYTDARNAAVSEAVEGLVALGYTATEAMHALSKAGDASNSGELIRLALRNIGS